MWYRVYKNFKVNLSFIFDCSNGDVMLENYMGICFNGGKVVRMWIGL